MIFHVLSIPVYPTKKEITLCAFTQKVYKFCDSMTRRGHTVFHYGHPESKVNCTQHFDVVSLDVYEEVYKNQKWQTFLPQNTNNKVHDEFNRNASQFIRKNKQSNKDFVLAFWGVGHEDCCLELRDDFIVVEPSVGYDSGFAPFKVFESYSQLHKMQFPFYRSNLPSFTDAVIPPGFYQQDFQYNQEKENYILFLGRMVEAKGINIAQELSKAHRIPIKFVGPQNLNNGLKKDNDLAEYIDTVSYKERKTLLSNAKALIMPSLFSEPCGWSMIEAFFSGTPVISTDWGGLSEYNKHGLTGFRCRSLNEFYHALGSIDDISPQYCRDYAKANFSIDLVCEMYENYFAFVKESISDGLGVIKANCKFLVQPDRL